MKTDIEIAQETVAAPDQDVAASIGVEEDDLELYGKYKAKFSDEYLKKVQLIQTVNLCLSLRSIRLRPAGKTTTAVGLVKHLVSLAKKPLLP